MFTNSFAALAYLQDKARKTMIPANEAEVVLPLISVAVQTIQCDIEKLRRYELQVAGKSDGAGEQSRTKSFQTIPDKKMS